MSSHTSPEGLGPFDRAAAAGVTGARLGVGVAEGPGGPWWTQLFGSCSPRLGCGLTAAEAAPDPW